MPAEPRACPCFSGAKYAACCKPLHERHRLDGTLLAPTPEALMRSRYAAFALGLGAYLVATLAEAHPDRASPEAALVRLLSQARERQRFLGLRIVESNATSASGRGEVLFVARIFERRVDRSFAELSDFVREEGAWRYASGALLPAAAFPVAPADLTRASFLAGLASGRRG